MTLQSVLESNLNKTQKAYRLYDLGYTRSDVAHHITNGNYGFAHNIWKKWNDLRCGAAPQQVQNFDFEFNFNRTFGIELEIFGPSRAKLISEFNKVGLTLSSQVYNHTTSSTWKIVSDSSVRGIGEANEIVSPVLTGADGIEQIKKVCLALNRAKAKVNSTCGFHVHFGVNDFTLDNFKHLVKNHVQMEKDFDSIVPVSRRKNNNTYCKGLTSIFGSKERTFRNIDSASTISDMMNKITSRYVKLNIKSYQRQGTVEFRQHSGTVTFSKIKNWILICARMVEFSKTNQLSNNLNSILNESLQDYFQDRKADLAA